LKDFLWQVKLMAFGLTMPNACALFESLKGMNLPGLRLHKLSGNLTDFYSVSISGNWRVIFRFDGNDVCDVNYLDYH
jgi:plasmid maintenance system killer protein